MNQPWKQVIGYLLTFVVLILFGASTLCASATHLLSANNSYVPFGNVIVGKTTSYRVLFTNTGSGTVKISRLNNVGQYFKTTSLPLPYTLAPGQVFSVNVAFTPTIAGAFAGNFSVISDATNSPSKIGDSGTGVTATTSLSVVPGAVNFGNVPVGVANTQTMTLLNKGRSGVRVTQVSASGAGFSLSGLTLPISIAPGRSSTFTLRFAPAKPGATTGAITIVNSVSTTAITASLAGNGVASSAQLTTDASALNFGGVTLGHPAMKTLTLTNTGNARLTVKGVNISGSEFSASGYAVPFALAAGQSASFMVQFAPTVAGGAAGNVLITSTASNPADNVPLSGSGTPLGLHSVMLTWNASQSTVVGYNVYRSLSNIGPFERLTSSALPGTTFTDLTVQAGMQYFYVATAVDALGIESLFSNEISVAIP